MSGLTVSACRMLCPEFKPTVCQYLAAFQPWSTHFFLPMIQTMVLPKYAGRKTAACTHHAALFHLYALVEARVTPGVLTLDSKHFPGRKGSRY